MLENKLYHLYDNLKKNFKGKDIGKFDEVVLYGELYGGTYAHKDIAKHRSAKKVQDGVQYRPDNAFAAFDLVLRFNDEDKSRNIVTHDSNLREFCYMSGLEVVPLLFKGTFKECLKFPNDNETLIPQILCLPSVENNISEGIVIKPAIPSYLNNGQRIMIKNKNEKFTEKQKNKPAKLPTIIPEHIQDYVNKGMEYVNINRVNAVISKMGEVLPKDFGKLIGNMNKDVIEDFTKDNEDFQKLEKKERKNVTSLLSSLIAQFLKTNVLHTL